MIFTKLSDLSRKVKNLFTIDGYDDQYGHTELIGKLLVDNKKLKNDKEILASELEKALTSLAKYEQDDERSDLYTKVREEILDECISLSAQVMKLRTENAELNNLIDDLLVCRGRIECVADESIGRPACKFWLGCHDGCSLTAKLTEQGRI